MVAVPEYSLAFELEKGLGKESISSLKIQYVDNLWD